MKHIQVFILLILCCFACSEKKTDVKKMNSENETTFNNGDSNTITATESSDDLKGIRVLKLIVDSENKTGKSNSIKLSDKNAIEEFKFIRELFPTEEIDSIEFYGNYDKQSVHAKNFPKNTLLIIYFNHKRLARNRVNLMEFEWSLNFKAAETVFKTGGIVFELDNQLCIYSIDTCDKKFKNMGRIDSIIKTALHQNSYTFERISTNCGKVSFQRKIN